jgi:hypothetical protein
VTALVSGELTARVSGVLTGVMTARVPGVLTDRVLGVLTARFGVLTFGFRNSGVNGGRSRAFAGRRYQGSQRMLHPASAGLVHWKRPLTAGSARSLSIWAGHARRVCVSAIVRRGDPQMWRWTRRADALARARGRMTTLAQSVLALEGEADSEDH